MITLRGPFMVSRKLAIRDDANIRLRCSRNVKKSFVLPMKNTRLTTTPSPLPCSPCVHSKRPRVYIQNVTRVCQHHASKCYHMRVWCLSTQRRFQCTHGGVLDGHTRVLGFTKIKRAKSYQFAIHRVHMKRREMKEKDLVNPWCR